MVRSAGWALAVVVVTMMSGVTADAAPEPGRAKGLRPPGKGNEQALKAEMLKRFDKDGDGKLNDQEQAAAKQAMQDRGGRPGLPGAGDGKLREEAIKKFDKDGDGKLNEEERAAAKKAFEDRGGRPGQPGAEGKGREEVLKRFDKDGDGKLNEEERAAAKKAFEERGGKK